MTQALRVQAATRVERTTVDGLGWSDVTDPAAPVVFAGERAFVPVSGGLGLLYALPFGVEARLNGQYVERAPDAAELFSKGMHEATGTFEIGNPFLTEEKASTVEIGLKKATGAFRFDASTYYTQYRGFIYRQLTGITCGTVLVDCDLPVPPDESFDQVVFQQRDATFYGAELAAQYDVAPIWNGVWGVDAQYDFVRAQFEDGENVPRIPPHRLGGGVYYHDANWLARVGTLHAFDAGRVRRQRDRHARLHAHLRRAELYDAGQGAGRHGLAGHRRHQGRKPRRRRGAQPHLVQAPRGGAAAGGQRARLWHRQTQLRRWGRRAGHPCCGNGRLHKRALTA